MLAIWVELSLQFGIHMLVCMTFDRFFCRKTNGNGQGKDPLGSFDILFLDKLRLLFAYMLQVSF